MAKERDRRSTKRRMIAFRQFAERHYGPLWYRSINTSTVNIGNPATCALAQLSGTADYYEALKRLGIQNVERRMQHAAILPYNLDERAREKGWHAAEVATLNRNMIALVDSLHGAERRARDAAYGYPPALRLWMRMTEGKRFIKMVAGDTGVAKTREARMSDPHRCAFALATGMRYADACAFYRVTPEDEIRYAFTIDVQEPDIFMEDLQAAWSR